MFVPGREAHVLDEAQADAQAQAVQRVHDAVAARHGFCLAGLPVRGAPAATRYPPKIGTLPGARDPRRHPWAAMTTTPGRTGLERKVRLKSSRVSLAIGCSSAPECFWAIAG